MRVRKRNGDTEPVDVNKIVRAVDRVSDGLPEVDPLRVATRTISGLYDGATTAELDRLSIQTAAELIGEEPEYSRLAARLLAGYVDKEVRGHGVASFSQSITLGHAEGLIGDDTASFVAANAVKLDVAVDADQRPPLRVLRPPDGRRPLPPAPPHDAPGHRDAAVLPAARRLRSGAHPARGDRPLPPDGQPGLPAEQPDAVQLGHPAHADELVLPRRLPARRARLDLRALPAGGAAVEVRRRHRHRLLAGPGEGRPHPRHERSLQRHRPVAAHARLLGRSGQPGRPPQGRGLRLPRAVAPRRRGVPRAA